MVKILAIIEASLNPDGINIGLKGRGQSLLHSTRNLVPAFCRKREEPQRLRLKNCYTLRLIDRLR